MADWIWRMPVEGIMGLEVAREEAIKVLLTEIGRELDRIWETKWGRCMPAAAYGRVALSLRRAIEPLTLPVDCAASLEYWITIHKSHAGKVIEPVSPGRSDAGCTTLQRYAYQWVAAAICQEVLYRLEQLPGAATLSADLPELPLAIRRTAVDVLLDKPWLGYHLGYWPAQMAGRYAHLD